MESPTSRARSLAGRHGELGARDLLHLSCCIRREVRAIMTFDRPLAAAFPHS
jgi:predicted nucleic acid-binding protein